MTIPTASGGLLQRRHASFDAFDLNGLGRVVEVQHFRFNLTSDKSGGKTS